MGNCQAAEAATVVIQHPEGRIERVYWSLSASQVMASNPGHYVAVIITVKSQTTPSGSNSSGSAPVKYLKLLRPDDTLHIGHVYRLVSFEEVLREFASKKRVKLSRLLVANKEKSRDKRGGGGGGGRAANPESSPATVVEGQAEAEDSGRRSGPPSRPGQWRPALQSIAEVGS